MKKNFIEELKWRGMLHDLTPGAEELLLREVVSGYIGFDPTSDSLGVGNLVQIMTLLHFQQCGHKPIALIGGATGLVGDPSGKTEERTLISVEQLQHNLEKQKKQLEKFLDFNCGKNAAEIVNNYDWLKDYTFLNFIRDVGKHITVNYMLAKESVQRRLESGLSFTEFSYQLVQGYDFYYLWKHKGVKLQLGGSDQWGNIVTGIELIKKMGGGEAYAITTPLITKTDGTKFGKTEKGNIWLDSKRTSPYHFYQFWINTSDEDVKKYIRIFSLKKREEIEHLEYEHFKAPHLRLLQNELAKEVTTRVHSESDYQMARKASEILFGSGTADVLRELDENTILQVFEGVPQFCVGKDELSKGINIVELLAGKTEIFSSRSEARKMISAGGVSINKEKITDVHSLINQQNLLQGRYILAQKGKKNYFLIKAV